jgi:eukaryotic-like serine/threonine-protein kinase
VKTAKAQTQKTVETILQAGQLVDGKYRVEHLLGEGGMAAVWAGTNERTGKRVALKVILRSLATTPAAQGLFHSEALASSRVNHPNVVTVFDVIEHEGMACIVMELLEGEPLGSYIARKGFLSINEAAELLLPAMRGVAAAHAQGVIHRDLKPQNIFVCIGPDGRIVTSKVLDFGISVMVERVMDSSAGPLAGLAMGTPAYMSPESLMGSASVDERADVYGFGVLLYEALTGQMPFPGEPGPALYERIVNEPAPSVRLFRPDLPPGWVRIIETALAKRPCDRYLDLNRMVSALEDQLMPATPIPSLATPPAGIPSLASRDSLARHSEPVVSAIASKEPSGPHQATQLYFPPERENQESAPSAEAIGGSERSLQEVPLRPPTGRDAALGEPTISLLKVPRSGLMALAALSGRRGLAGLGLAVALVVGAWIGGQIANQMQFSAPVPVTSAILPESQPVAPPAVPAFVSSTTIPSAAGTAPLPPSPTTTLATPGPRKPPGRARAVPVSHGRLRVAVQEAPRQPLRQRVIVRDGARRDELAPRPSAGASASAAAPRAGPLSEEDF